MNAEIARLLSNTGYILVNKTIIKSIGLHEAIILGELCAEYTYYENRGELVDGAFYSTRENIEENTGLNSYHQRECLARLEELGIVKIVKIGMPAKNFYKLDFSQISKFLTTSGLKIEPQVVQNLDLNNNKIDNSKKRNNSSKELLDTEPADRKFLGSIGKPDKSLNLYTKCKAMLDNFILQNPKVETGRTYSLLLQYLQLRLEIKDKPLYANQWKGMLSKLLTILTEDSNQEPEKIIQQSIDRAYLGGFYPVNAGRGRGSESGVQSKKYTEAELKDLEKLSATRIQRGERAYF